MEKEKAIKQTIELMKKLRDSQTIKPIDRFTLKQNLWMTDIRIVSEAENRLNQNGQSK